MENIHPKIETVLPDLQFVLEKDILAIIAEFKNRYAQTVPETAIQEKLHAISANPESLSKEQVFEFYGIKKEKLELLYVSIEEKAESMGVKIEYVDMTGFSEDEYHKNYENNPDHVMHAETARSDGKTLLLEKNIEAAGGITGRTYDLLHLAFGHMVQWSTEESNMLLNREQAWSIGYRNHDKSPKVVIDLMSLYEFEAGMQGIEALRQALDGSEIPEDQKQSIAQYFTDYVYADRDYIIQHYRGNHEKFEKFWKFGQPIPPRQELPHVKEFIERHAVEVGLIKDTQNK